MKAPDSRETLEIIPRYLALCIEEGDSRFYFSPTSDIMGNILRRSPQIISRIVSGTGKYKKWQAEERKRHRSYDPKFPWPEELLSEDPENLPEILREAIKKKEGAYILFDAQPHEAVKNLTLKGNVLSALVKSKRGADETRPTYHITSMRSIFVDEFGNPDLAVIECNCDDYSYDLEKGGRKKSFMHEMHSSAMRGEFESREYHSPQTKKPTVKKGRIPKQPIFSPFGFNQNWVYRSGMYLPKSKPLAALEGDVLLTYYVIAGSNDDIFGINERLLTIEESLSPSMLEWIRSGIVTRRVLGQKRKAAKVNYDKWFDDKQIDADFFGNIRAFGYEYDGMSREFGHVSRRFVNESTGNIVSIVFRAHEVPFYVVREIIPGKKPNPTAEQPYVENPLKLLGKKNLITLDDVKMTETKTRVELPSTLRLPGSEAIDMGLNKNTRMRFRDAIRTTYGQEVLGLEKYARVHF